MPAVMKEAGTRTLRDVCRCETRELGIGKPGAFKGLVNDVSISFVFVSTVTVQVPIGGGDLG